MVDDINNGNDQYDMHMCIIKYNMYGVPSSWEYPNGCMVCERKNSCGTGVPPIDWEPPNAAKSGKDRNFQ